MKKQLILSLLSLAAGLTATASPISPEQALHRVSGNSALRKARSMVQPVLVHSTPGAYVFNSASEGYMILSADDCALPMLGYSDNGRIDPANIPPQMQWWLEQYDRQIAYAREHNLTPAAAPMRTPKEAIAPLVATKWDQIEPFNNQCPLYGTDRTYTGCVATAMAQVMNYWKYPEKGQGSISYTASSIEKKLSLNFALKTIDWDNMKNTYYDGYTIEQADAAAYLMKAAAYSVKMDFSLDASGALAMDIANGLVKYFNYDGNINYTLRDYYSSEQWADMLYDNLKNVGPLLYGGGSYIGGGHSFVCDGYDGNGFFHFNWGWSGMSDGYFSLDALSPGSLGAGAGGGNYSFTQDAVFGIQPPTGKPVEPKNTPLTQMGSLTAEINGSKITFNLTETGESMWVNYNPQTLKLTFGVLIEPQGETAGQTRGAIISSRVFTIQPGYGTGPEYVIPQIDNLNDYNLADGTYKLTVASVPMVDNIPSTDIADWVAVKAPYSYFNYVTLTKSGTTYTVENGKTPQLKISGELVGELYSGASSTWRVTVENLSDVEAVSGFAPCLADENLGPVYLGQSIYVTIPPHTTVTKEWSTMLYQLQQYSISGPTQLGFTFFNEVDYVFYDQSFLEEVTMLPAPEAAVLSFVKGPEVKDATIKNSLMMQSLQIIPDPTNIEITATPKLESGYFSYPMVCCLCSQGENGYLNINAASGNTVVLSEPGETVEFSTVINYPLMEANTTYYLVMAYEVSEGYIPLNVANSTAQIRWAGKSGIDEVATDSQAKSATFDLQGRLVKNPLRGIYISNGRKVLR